MELVFILAFLSLAGSLLAALISALRGRRKKALSLATACAASSAIYMTVLITVAILSPQRVLAVGEDHCFDDWCIAVSGFTVAPQVGESEKLVKAEGKFYVVTLRLSNRARGREQRAGSVAVHLLDQRLHVHDVSIRGQRAFESEHGVAAPLTSTIAVGQFIDTVQVFDLPTDSAEVSLTVEHPVGPSPGLFVIGDESSLLHRPTIVRLH